MTCLIQHLVLRYNVFAIFILYTIIWQLYTFKTFKSLVYFQLYNLKTFKSLVYFQNYSFTFNCRQFYNLKTFKIIVTLVYD